MSSMSKIVLSTSGRCINPSTEEPGFINRIPACFAHETEEGDLMSVKNDITMQDILLEAFEYA